MTVWERHRIPICVAPLPDEALDSWIEAYARRLRCTSLELLRLIGLAGRRPSAMVIRLEDDEQRSLSAATGVPIDVLTTSTLERFNGSVIAIRAGSRGFAARPPAWRRVAGSRFCPPCLQHSTGRWQLSWRLPWTFACPIHNLLLVEICPGCGRRPAPAGSGRRGVTEPGTCTTASGIPETPRLGLCGYQLMGAPTQPLPAGGHILTAQARIDQLLKHLPEKLDGPDNPQAVLTDLFTLARRVLRAPHPTHDLPDAVQAVIGECARDLAAPMGLLDTEDANAVAVGSAIAVIAHNPGHPARDEVLNWIITSDLDTRRETRSSNLGYLLKPWRQTQTPLMSKVLAHMDGAGDLLPGVRLRYASASPTPAPPTLLRHHTQTRAAMIPSQLWPSWSMRLLVGSAQANILRPHSFRTALATMLLLPGSTATYRDLAGILGAQPDQPAFRTMVGTLDEQQLTATVSTLAQLAQALDRNGSPIDYARRRDLGTRHPIELDRSAYDRLCTRQGWRRATPAHITVLEQHLAYLLTGAMPRQTNPTTDAPDPHIVRWNTLRYTMPPPLRAFLINHVEEHLDRRGLTEPATWEPPSDWIIKPADWPGTDPDRIDTTAFQTAADHGDDITVMARGVDMHPEHIRLFMDATGITASRPTDDSPRPARLRIPHQGLLEPATLRALYEDQKLSIRTIATMARCRTSVVSEAMCQAGITTRKAYGQRPLPITREWLDHEYTIRGRTLEDIAHQLDISRTRIGEYANEWDIPIRPKGRTPDPLQRAGLRHNLAPELEAAFAGRKAVERMRRIVQLPNFDSMSTAASELGVRHSVLTLQLHQIEIAVGFKILSVGQPLIPTARGHALLIDAQRVLARLDEIANTARH